MLGWKDFKRMTAREIALQAAVLLFIVLLVIGAVRSAQINLAALGITSGFSFLERDTGWSYSFSLVERTIDDTYRRTLTIGFMNTLFVGFISIVFATIFGFIIGTMRDSRNLGLEVISSIYVQIFRNIPLILQVVFVYSILIHLPGPRQAYSLGDVFFMSGRGIYVPVLSIPLSVAAVVTLCSIVIGFGAARFASSGFKVFVFWLLGTVAALAIAVAFFTPEGESAVSIPSLQGLRFRGGLTLSVELVAMILAIVLYSAAYIAEVVRGGLDEVPKGLVEAG
ncbi:MAG: ABC transporter permease subunit, partial [Pseudomonadota bacterium]